MQTLRSKDGTIIAFDQIGAGPPLILVGGIFEQRAMESETAQIAAHPLLAQYFTVIHYDRRGRGDSTDTPPYAVAREIEDIDALIDYVGGRASVFAISSGAALALEASLVLGGKMQHLALYEPPYNDDVDARQAWQAFRHQLADLLAADRRSDAVALFMSLMGTPADQLAAMRQYPMWPMWEAIAPTLAYDVAVLGDDASVPREQAARVAVPTLVINGEASYPFMQATAAALAQAIPYAHHLILPGQAHEVSAEAIVPVLVEFFTSATVGR